jgi:hypothetical protein
MGTIAASFQKQVFLLAYNSNARKAFRSIWEGSLEIDNFATVFMAFDSNQELETFLRFRTSKVNVYQHPFDDYAFFSKWADAFMNAPLVEAKCCWDALGGFSGLEPNASYRFIERLLSYNSFASGLGTKDVKAFDKFSTSLDIKNWNPQLIARCLDTILYYKTLQHAQHGGLDDECFMQDLPGRPYCQGTTSKMALNNVFANLIEREAFAMIHDGTLIMDLHKYGQRFKRDYIDPYLAAVKDECSDCKPSL